MGLDFYKKAVELEKKYGRGGQVINNSLQTNAIVQIFLFLPCIGWKLVV
jgi:sulfatase maturation enzyme AslB (radical SAM superfamily)